MVMKSWRRRRKTKTKTCSALSTGDYTMAVIGFSTKSLQARVLVKEEVTLLVLVEAVGTEAEAVEAEVVEAEVEGQVSQGLQTWQATLPL